MLQDLGVLGLPGSRGQVRDVVPSCWGGRGGVTRLEAQDEGGRGVEYRGRGHLNRGGRPVVRGGGVGRRSRGVVEGRRRLVGQGGRTEVGEWTGGVRHWCWSWCVRSGWGRCRAVWRR